MELHTRNDPFPCARELQPCFKGEESGAQRGAVTCPKSHSKLEREQD